MVEQLFHDLSQLPEVEAIALGGSRTGSCFDEKSDYDIYLYCTSPVPLDKRRQIIDRYATYVEYGNHFWEEEDNGTLHNGVDFDLLFRNLDDFAAGLSRVVEKGQASNGYTTCMWHNLKTCKIIFDRTGRLDAVKKRFDVPYPAELKQNIIQRNRKLLQGTLPAYDSQIKKAMSRGDQVSINHRVSAFLESYFDLIFALNEQTHPGEKRLVRLCRDACRILPENFEENITSLFSHMFTDSAAAERDLDRMIQEIDKLL